MERDPRRTTERSKNFTFTVDTGKEVGLSQYKHNVLCFSAIEASVADQSNKEKSAVSATFCADVVKWLTPDKSSPCRWRSKIVTMAEICKGECGVGGGAGPQPGHHQGRGGAKEQLRRKRIILLLVTSESRPSDEEPSVPEHRS
ncbi:hypothetical protein F2P81_019417 [Scophthalmus maximus]|uniref:Uncharacterized protein n=1 Tax=Scophthalmus maximus TaxID=52904 RepID=A0A6A4S9M8_SCOMX|nr:hypothetical protein F2P81_019417 [Scophthalmus maximus]